MPTPFPHTCTITRPGLDERPLDEESGQPVGEEPDASAVYTGRCFFDPDGQAVERELGGDVDVAGKAVLRLPKPTPQIVFDHDTDEVAVSANGVTYAGAGILVANYERRRVVLVLDLERRPVAG